MPADHSTPEGRRCPECEKPMQPIGHIVQHIYDWSCGDCLLAFKERDLPPVGGDEDDGTPLCTAGPDGGPCILCRPATPTSAEGGEACPRPHHLLLPGERCTDCSFTPTSAEGGEPTLNAVENWPNAAPQREYFCRECQRFSSVREKLNGTLLESRDIVCGTCGGFMISFRDRDPAASPAEGGEARDGTGDPCVDCGWMLRWRSSMPGYGYCINPACPKQGVDRTLYLSVAPTLAATGGEEALSPETLSEMHRAFLDLLQARDIVSIATQPEYATEMFHVVTAPLRRQLAEAERASTVARGTMLRRDVEFEQAIADRDDERKRAGIAERQRDEAIRALGTEARMRGSAQQEVARLREALEKFANDVIYALREGHDGLFPVSDRERIVSAREVCDAILSSPHQSTGQGGAE